MSPWELLAWCLVGVVAPVAVVSVVIAVLAIRSLLEPEPEDMLDGWERDTGDTP